MKLETQLSCGDKAFVVTRGVVKIYTVGQIKVTHTDAKYVDDWHSEGGVTSYSGGDSLPENYRDQTGYKEEYMCNETGIGSGSVFEFGKNIFKTREEAETTCAEQIEEEKKRVESVRAYEKERRRQEYELAKLKIQNLAREFEND